MPVMSLEEHEGHTDDDRLHTASILTVSDINLIQSSTIVRNV